MSLARSFFWLTIAEILFNISGFVVHSGAGRLLTPEDYGRYGLIVTLTIMVVTLIGNGLPISMSKYLSEFYQTKPELVPYIKRKGLIIQGVIIGFICVVFYLFTPALANLLDDPTLTPLFRISIFIIPMYALDSLYFYYLTGIHEFNFQSFLKILRSILRVTLILGMIYFWKLQGAIAGYIFVPFIVFLAALIADWFWFSKKYPRGEAPITFDWKKLLHYAWPITLFMIFYEVLISLDLYFIKAILNDDYQTGIYNSALMLARIPYYLFYALTIILLPSISELTAQNNYEKARSLIAQSLRFMIILLVPIVLLIAIYAAPAIQFVFGAKYLEATASLQILSFGIGFLSIFYVLSFAINGTRPKIPMTIAGGGMVLNAILNYFFIQRYGIVGSAIATTISSFIVMIISVIHTYNLFGKIVYFHDIAKMLFAGAVLYLCSFLFPAQPMIFIGWSIILTLIYFFVLYLIKAIKEEDIKIVTAMLTKKKHP